MKRVICIIVVLAVGSYIVNSYLQNRVKREAERAEAERIEQNIKSSVAKMVSRTNAVDSWEQQLSKGERFRFGPILSIELEKLWLANRPILFLGSISDIATHDEDHYLVSVERSLFGIFDYVFYTELQLSLISEKARIDSFLNQNPDLLKEYGFNNGVAIIAKIGAIRTIYIPVEEGERVEVKIGDGELIDIIFTGMVQL
jgi:ABC-type multidrug transport system fused ATPase/permease subunit